MTTYQLQLTLESDATFGRGDGVAGLVDAEVQHDAVGLPYLAGRTLKGLLYAECDDIVFALAAGDRNDHWRAVKDRLFGVSGADLVGAGLLHVGPARLPGELHEALAYDIDHGDLARADVLETLTVIRRQTAMDETGAPRPETLRAFRAVLRGLTFTADLSFEAAPDDDALALLAATVKALRRVGTGRNRGRGKVRARLLDAGGSDVTNEHFTRFAEEVR